MALLTKLCLDILIYIFYYLYQLYLEYPIYVKTHISHTNSFNIHVSIGLITLADMLIGYEVCLNTTNYPICIMQDFKY